MFDIQIIPLTAEHEDLFYEHCIRKVKNSRNKDSLPHTPLGLNTNFPPEKRKRTMDGLSLAITEPGWFRIWAVWYEGKIIGNIMLKSLELETLIHRAHLSMNLEEDKFRNYGIGTQMMEIAINWAKEQPSLRWIDLGVFHANHPAITLYKKFHFKTIGGYEDYFDIEGQSFQQILMTLKL